MSETTTSTPREVPEGMPPTLDAAIAAFQAELPRITKGDTGKVEGVSKSGKQFSYEYKYADLADMSGTVLPLLGSLGMAYTSRTVIRDRDFMLVCTLRHVSGERDESEWPLGNPVAAGPQTVGGQITYARRYCLGAMTGVQPDGEDDDAAQAQKAPRTAGDAWENATPARLNGQRNGNGHGNGHAVRPAASEPQVQANGEPDPDAQQYADEAHEARTLTALQDIQKRAREAGKLTAVIVNPATQGKGRLAEFIDFHRKRLQEIDHALALLNDVAKRKNTDLTEVEIELKRITGKGIEDATPAEMRKAAEQMLAGVPA